MKRTYRSPLSSPTEVAFEQALLVTTARFLVDVEEAENVNKTLGTTAEEPGGGLYFEF